MNLILFILGLSLLIFIHEFGHFIFAKLFNVYCLEFSIGMGPAIISKKFKKDEETTYSLRCLPIGGYVSMAGETGDNDEEKQLEIPYQRTINGVSPWKRAIITGAGVLFNFILAILLLGIFTFGNGVSTNDNTIAVTSNSIAEKSGLVDGDKIIAVKNIKIKANGTTIYEDLDCVDTRCETTYFTSFKTYLDSKEIKDAAYNYAQDNPQAIIQQEITIIFQHSDEEKTTSLSRIYDHTKNSFPLLGISETTRIPNLIEGIGLTFQRFGEIFALMFEAISSLFTPEGFDSLGGVVSMYQMSKLTASQGFFSYLWFLSVISINLGFFNLLPIPALDGARLYISICEGITKKKLNPKIEGYMNLIGLVLLFGLMIVVTVKDVIGLF